MKKLIIILLLIVGCAHTTEPAMPPQGPVYEQRMSPEMYEAVMTLVYMKSDSNVFNVKEKDPFRK